MQATSWLRRQWQPPALSLVILLLGALAWWLGVWTWIAPIGLALTAFSQVRTVVEGATAKERRDALSVILSVMAFEVPLALAPSGLSEDMCWLLFFAFALSSVFIRPETRTREYWHRPVTWRGTPLSPPQGESDPAAR